MVGPGREPTILQSKIKKQSFKRNDDAYPGIRITGVHLNNSTINQEMGAKGSETLCPKVTQYLDETKGFPTQVSFPQNLHPFHYPGVTMAVGTSTW